MIEDFLMNDCVGKIEPFQPFFYSCNRHHHHSVAAINKLQTIYKKWQRHYASIFQHLINLNATPRDARDLLSKRDIFDR